MTALWSRLRIVAFTAVGLTIGGAIIVCCLLPALRAGSGQPAGSLADGRTDTLLAQAATELAAVDDEGGQAKSFPALKSRVLAALASEPLNAALFSVLGLIADAEGDQNHADLLMKTAVTLSQRDTIAGIWLLRERYAARDYVNACRYAGVLLRGNSAVIDVVAPLLTRMLESPAGADPARQLILKDASWRRQYLLKMLPVVNDPRTPLRLMMVLKAAGADVSMENIRVYLSFLGDLKLYDLAYTAWLQFLPVAQLENAGFLFNGNFSYEPSGAPFDWQIKSGVGYTAEIVATPSGDGDRALSLQFGEGRIEAIDVRQTLVLRAGRYVLRGRYIADLGGPRGVQWTVRCHDIWTPFDRGPVVVGVFAQWQSFEWMFQIPDRDCPAQELRLAVAARSPSEQFIRGNISFDDLSIRRADNAAP